MLVRGIGVLLVGMVLAGCTSNEPISTGLTTTALASEGERDPATKTLAAKVLAAIALERVTGRKADPARLADLN